MNNACVKNILVLITMAHREIMFKNVIEIENSELCIVSAGAEGADWLMRRQKDLENSKKIWEWE